MLAESNDRICLETLPREGDLYLPRHRRRLDSHWCQAGIRRGKDQEQPLLLLAMTRPADEASHSGRILDSGGLPLAWRRPHVSPAHLEGSAVSFAIWGGFEDWCQQQSVSALPASPRTVMRFLRSRQGQLSEIWEVISSRHEAYYWHTDANPIRVLELGEILIRGTGRGLVIPDSERVRRFMASLDLVLEWCGRVSFQRGQSPTAGAQLGLENRGHVPWESDRVSQRCRILVVDSATGDYLPHAGSLPDKPSAGRLSPGDRLPMEAVFPPIVSSLPLGSFAMKAQAEFPGIDSDFTCLQVS